MESERFGGLGGNKHTLWKNSMTRGKPSETCGDFGGKRNNGEPCGRASGWGTSNDSGRCRKCLGTSEDGSSHEGNDFAAGNSGGAAPEKNQNATTHGLNADPKNYKENQDGEDEDWIRCVRESILDRIRKSGSDPDFLDKVLAERVAIQLHIAANATEHVDEEGLIQTVFVEDGGYEKDIPNGLVSELRQFDKDIIGNLKKLGVLNDPQSQTANRLEDVGKALMENLEENY